MAPPSGTPAQRVPVYVGRPLERDDRPGRSVRQSFGKEVTWSCWHPLICGPTVTPMTEPPRPPGEGVPGYPDPNSPGYPPPTSGAGYTPPPTSGAGYPPPAGGYPPPTGGYPPPGGGYQAPGAYQAPGGRPAPIGYANNDEKTWALVSHFGGAAGMLVVFGV